MPRKLILASIAALAAGLLFAASASATQTVIRVGGPSRPAHPKTAIVATDRSLGGKPFRAVRIGLAHREHRENELVPIFRAPAHSRRRGGTVLRGRLHPAKGSSAPWKHAYAANVSKLRKPGRYRVIAGGYVNSEPAIDYAAPSILMLAALDR